MVLDKILFCLLITAPLAKTQRTVVCYYNSKTYYREGQGQFNLSAHVIPALQHCTHVVYGFAAINPNTYKLEPLDQHVDVEMQYYENVVNLRRNVIGLEVLLSVGGNEDTSGDDPKQKYLSLLESPENRNNFIDSAMELLKRFKFDGLDLAWQFPETKPKESGGGLSSAFHSLKNKIDGKSSIDDNDERSLDHNEQFALLVQGIKDRFKSTNYRLTLTVLPNVNSSLYLNPLVLAPHFDFITLMLYDFYTPTRNPIEADYTSPIYDVVAKRRENIDKEVRFWIDYDTPTYKIILGVATFGRVWKLHSSITSELPPVPADGAADGGPFIKEKGMWSYPEICQALGNPNKKKRVQKFTDPTMRYGTYAFRLPKENEHDGIWMGFEDPDSVSKKAIYVRAKGLGGFAINDITLDDFSAFCGGHKFPILRAAKMALM